MYVVSEGAKPASYVLVEAHLNIEQLLQIHKHGALLHAGALVVADVLLLLAELRGELLLLSNLVRVELTLGAELQHQVVLAVPQTLKWRQQQASPLARTDPLPA